MNDLQSESIDSIVLGILLLKAYAVVSAQGQIVKSRATIT